MRLVQTWGVLFPDELGAYTALYVKHKKKGVLFTLPEPSDFVLTAPNGNTLETCLAQIDECTLMIRDVLKSVAVGLHRQAALSLLTHSRGILASCPPAPD